MEDLRNRIEAILFASGKGVTEEELAGYCEANLATIKKSLSYLQKDLDGRMGSLIISLHNNRWKMTVRGKYLKDVESIVSETELPSPVLRTLAVIAYKSPVLQADIIHMRGQSAYEHIKELTKQKFVTKEERGRSFLIKITDKFYNYFDVEGDEEIQDVFSKLREKQKTLGDLEIIDVKLEKKEQEEKKEEDKTHLGELDVVDVAPRTREKTKEDEQEEKTFLARIDESINQISKRVEEHKLPNRERKEQEEANNIIEQEETSQDSTEEREEEKQKTQQEAEENPLSTMEKFAEKTEDQKEDDYL
ncbi:SMC-Scp complex subunit ScpB [Candidatus Woesearchaeota archaeon]|nr:SMC-Scp complex subunit ScpB [Candidatus Woesearchaeota archaeon]